MNKFHRNRSYHNSSDLDHRGKSSQNTVLVLPPSSTTIINIHFEQHTRLRLVSSHPCWLIPISFYNNQLGKPRFTHTVLHWSGFYITSIASLCRGTTITANQLFKPVKWRVDWCVVSLISIRYCFQPNTICFWLAILSQCNNGVSQYQLISHHPIKTETSYGFAFHG